MNGVYGNNKVWAEIDLSALRHNWRTVRDRVRRASPDCRVIATVKADAYGHGAEAVSRALAEEGCDFFAVSCIREALQVREYLGPEPDILILGYTPAEDAALLCRNGIIQTVFSADFAASLSREAERLKTAGALPADASLRIHVKLDTGMNRLGFDASDAPRAAGEIAEVCALPHLTAEGMFTHFACADVDRGEGKSALQHERFCLVADLLQKKGVCPPMLHCCNSAGALHMPQAYHNAVRAGVILYGMAPDGSILEDYRPVMTLKARVAHIHTLRAGESVSYGATFTAERDMRIATIPIGYGDGFVRRYAGASVRLPDGAYAPVTGRICMDQCMIAIGDSPVQPGDTVTVFGGDDGTMLEELARRGETINYEIPCILTPRVPRIVRE
jgi:alanine racemase